MSKQWFTARELAELELPGVPKTQQGVDALTKRENWAGRSRSGRGGGNEYHLSSLPAAAQAALIERMVDQGNLDTLRPELEAAKTKSERRRDARLIILRQLELYRIETMQPAGKAVVSFVLLYKNRMVSAMPSWIYDVFPSVSERTLWRWKDARSKENFKALGKSQNNRAGTGILDRAEDGAVKDHIAALIVSQPHLTAGHIRDLTRAKFGDALHVKHIKTGREYTTGLPDIRTFTRWIAKWKKENAVIIDKITNPDGYKNKYMMAIGKADAGVTALNQLWEIDASPCDVLCEDGRYNLYAIIDVWSRRTLFLVSRTAKTEASLMLVRKAILEWGVPQAIKTDNGSDFTSYRFMSALISLEIDQPVCQPFTPERKPHVERVIETLQHGFMPLLPGFIGHNVKDRKQIEARKSFARRLGVEDEKTFAVSLTHEKLQQYIDQWAADKYANTPHRDLSGDTPLIRAASWTDPVRRVENVRALDLLLSPLAGQKGYRTVGKKGLKIDNGYFYGPGIELHVGRRVFVRHDPEDMGKVYVFTDEDGKFICEAINLERKGAPRKELAAYAKASQKEFMRESTKELNRLKRQITPEKIVETYMAQVAKDASHITALPHRSEIYNTEGLKQAARAIGKTPIKEDSAEEKKARAAFVEKFKEEQAKQPKPANDKDRWWARAKDLDAREARGEELSEEDKNWLTLARKQSWYRANRDLELMRNGESVFPT